LTIQRLSLVKQELIPNCSWDKSRGPDHNWDRKIGVRS